MFVLLIILFVFLANKDGVSRQARLNRDLAALRRAKMEAEFAARRAQTRIDQIEAVRALSVAGQVQVTIDGHTVSASGPVQVVVNGNTVYSVTPAAYHHEAGLKADAHVMEMDGDGWFRILN